VTDPLKLAERLRHRPLELRRRARSLPGDDILSLHTELEVHHHLVGTGGRIASESHSRSRVHASVTEDHRLHSHGRGRRRFEHLGLEERLDPSPACRTQHRGGRKPQLLAHIGWESASGQVGKESLIVGGQPPETAGIEFCRVRYSLAVQRVPEQRIVRSRFVQEDDLSHALDQPTVGIPSKVRVPGHEDEPVQSLPVQTDVEQGLHEPGHGHRSPRPHGDQKGPSPVPILEAGGFLHEVKSFGEELWDVSGELAPCPVEVVTDAHPQGEARRHGDRQRHHAGQIPGLAAELVL